MEDRRLKVGPALAVVLAFYALLLWGCWREPAPTPLPTPTRVSTPDCVQTMHPLETRLAEAEATLFPLGTLVYDALVRCALVWDQCCAVLTDTPCATPQATYTPRPTYTPAVAGTFIPGATWTAVATYTPYPTPTVEPVFCRRCIQNDETYGCPPGYICELCETCYYLCVPEVSPRAGCHFCAGILIP